MVLSLTLNIGTEQEIVYHLIFWSGWPLASFQVFLDGEEGKSFWMLQSFMRPEVV